MKTMMLEAPFQSDYSRQPTKQSRRSQGGKTKAQGFPRDVKMKSDLGLVA